MTITFRGTNGGSVSASYGGATWTNSSWTLYYTVSSPPSGGGGGSVRISPMTQYTQKAIKPAWISGSTAHATTKTFLVASGQKEG